MNYGKKFLYILWSAAGLYLIIIGIAFKTGYYPGHSESSAYACIAMGVAATLLGLIRLHRS